MANQLQREAEDKGQAAECLVEAVVASAAECPAEVEPECPVECLEALEAGHKVEGGTGVMVLVCLVETTLWVIRFLVQEALVVVVAEEVQQVGVDGEAVLAQV